MPQNHDRPTQIGTMGNYAPIYEYVQVHTPSQMNQGTYYLHSYGAERILINE